MIELTKTALLGKSFDEIKSIVIDLGMPAFTARQITEWLYKKNISEIDEMTNISLKNREVLKIKYEIGKSTPITTQKSQDGTKKYLFNAGSNQFIETVYIPEEDRATLCVSSQVGCKMNCIFCMTGKQGFNGQLSATEIMNQIVSVPEYEKLTNIVFMGMGEPLDNTDEVLQSLNIITSDYGLAWSPKRVTVSTIGVIPGMKQFLDNSSCHLAVSLHTPFHEERLKIMPVEKAYPIKEVIELIRQYDFSKQRRVSFEYIMFDDFNDSIPHAKELIKLLKGIVCRVNLIRFHAIPDVNLKSSNEKKMIAFRDYLTEHGVICTIRRSRGEDILAACGMLSTLKTYNR